MPKMDAMVLDEIRRLLEPIEDTDASDAVFRCAWRVISAPAVDADPSALVALDERASGARQRWQAAGLAFIDGRSSKSRYELLRDEALSELEAVEDERRRLTTDRDSDREGLPDADEMLALAQGWRQALGGEDPLARRQALSQIIERVVPVRLSHGKYTVTIEWTSLARALRQCSQIPCDEAGGTESTMTF